MNILVKTMFDLVPMALFIISVVTVVHLVIFVGTHDGRKVTVTSAYERKGKSWDLVRPTRFIDLG